MPTSSQTEFGGCRQGRGAAYDLERADGEQVVRGARNMAASLAARGRRLAHRAVRWVPTRITRAPCDPFCCDRVATPLLPMVDSSEDHCKNGRILHLTLRMGLPLKRGSLSSSATGSALIACPFRKCRTEDVLVWHERRSLGPFYRI